MLLIEGEILCFPTLISNQRLVCFCCNSRVGNKGSNMRETKPTGASLADHSLPHSKSKNTLVCPFANKRSCFICPLGLRTTSSLLCITAASIWSSFINLSKAQSLHCNLSGQLWVSSLLGSKTLSQSIFCFRGQI